MMRWLLLRSIVLRREGRGEVARGGIVGGIGLLIQLPMVEGIRSQISGGRGGAGERVMEGVGGRLEDWVKI